MNWQNYHRENLLARSLSEMTYKNNPNFTNWAKKMGLPFKPHSDFKKADVVERQALYQAICEQIWAFPPHTDEL